MGSPEDGFFEYDDIDLKTENHEYIILELVNFFNLKEIDIITNNITVYTSKVSKKCDNDLVHEEIVSDRDLFGDEHISNDPKQIEENFKKNINQYKDNNNN